MHHNRFHDGFTGSEKINMKVSVFVTQNTFNHFRYYAVKPSYYATRRDRAKMAEYREWHSNESVRNGCGMLCLMCCIALRETINGCSIMYLSFILSSLCNSVQNSE